MDILKILIDIWADQHGVEVKEITVKEVTYDNHMERQAVQIQRV